MPEEVLALEEVLAVSVLLLSVDDADGAFTLDPLPEAS